MNFVSNSPESRKFISPISAANENGYIKHHLSIYPSIHLRRTIEILCTSIKTKGDAYIEVLEFLHSSALLQEFLGVFAVDLNIEVSGRGRVARQSLSWLT